MGRIIGLVLVAVAVVIGIVLFVNRGDDSEASAQSDFCSSLTALDSSLENLQGLEPGSASKDDYESAVSEIEDDWDQVKDDAGSLAEADTSTLDDAWDDFKSAVDDVPDDGSVSDAKSQVSSAAQTLTSTVQSTLNGPDCSSS